MTPAAFVAALAGAGPTAPGPCTGGSRPRSAPRSSAGSSRPARGSRRSGSSPKRLAVSRTTVVSAYEDLRQRGAIESRRGSGTRVRGRTARPPALQLREDPSGSFRRHPVWRSFTEGPGGTIEFLGAHLPAPEILAREAARIDEKALRALARGPGYLPMGLPALRQAIAAAPRRHRDCETSEDQVLVTHGAQQAIGLAGALLVERGETVVVEDPTYLGSIDIFSGQGARLVTVGVGGDAGWVDAPEGRRGPHDAAARVPDADVPEPDRRRHARVVPPRARAAVARPAAADRRGQHARRSRAVGPPAGADRGVRDRRRRC